MTQINIRGYICTNSEKAFCDAMGLETTAPKDIILPENGEDVEVMINSGGGEIFSGSEMYSILKNYPGKVTVKIVGLAGSAASVIAMAGDVVEISPTAQIMIHNVSTYEEGDFNDLRHTADVIENSTKALSNAYMLKTGLSTEELLDLMEKETWLSAGQAVEKGFADKIMFMDDTDVQLVASANDEIIGKFINFENNQRKEYQEMVASLNSRIEILEKNHINENKTKQEKEVPKGFGAFHF